jgi:hypothetical protein
MGIHSRKFCWLSAFLALVACQEAAAPTKQSMETRFGDQAPLMGKALWGQEDVSIILCEGLRADCEFPLASEKERDCALIFSDAGWAALQKFVFDRDETGAPSGEVWLEGRGVRTLEAGYFGHLGAHACEVRFDSVIRVDRGEPWFFEPPPPE